MIRSPVPPSGPSQGAAGPELTLRSQLPRHGAQAVASSPLAESLHTALLAFHLLIEICWHLLCLYLCSHSQCLYPLFIVGSFGILLENRVVCVLSCV